MEKSRLEKKTYVGFYVNPEVNQKMEYIMDVFSISKTRLIHILIGTKQDINQLYDLAKEYRETYSAGDGLDITWMVQKKIIL